MIKSTNKACAAIQCLFWISYCFAFGFLVAYLTSIGYSKSVIGFVMATLATTSIIVQPIYGYLSDKVFDIKKIVFCCMAVASVSVAILPIAAKNIFSLFLVCIVIGASEYCLASLVDCWCIKLSHKKPVNYGVGRAVGSLGYAVTALIFGYVFARVDMQLTFYLNFVSCGIALILIAKTEGCPIEKVAAARVKKKSTFARDMSVLIKDRSYIIFVICAAMTFIGSSATISFTTNLLELRGGTAEHLGYALFAQAGFEVPFMLMSGWLLKKFNIKFLLIFAFFAYIIKYLAPALMPSVWGIIAVQALQGISFGIFLPAAMKYLAIIAPEGLKTTATTIAVAIYTGVGNIAGNAIGGIVADNFGVRMVYIFASALAAFSAVVFLLFGFRREK